MRTHIEGLIAAPFTPMHADGQLNLDAIGPMASLLGRQGVAGVFVGGSTGESLSLTLQERLDLTRTWISSAPRGQKVLIHVGAGSIEDSKAIAAHAQQHGATAIASMAPVFFKPRNHEELVAYCGAVASAAPELPFYYYHIPFRTGVCLPVAGFLRAASTRVPKLAGVKFTHEDLMEKNMIAAARRVAFFFSDDNAAHVTEDGWKLFEAAIEWAQQGTRLSVEDETIDVPVIYQLYQNYPNPFNPTTHILYFLKNEVAVSIKVYNMIGQLAATLVDQRQPYGIHNVQWNGRDDQGDTVGNGIYLYKMQVGDYTQTRKMVLMR